MAKVSKLATPSASEDVAGSELSGRRVLVETAKGTTLKNSLSVFLKLGITVPYNPAILLLEEKKRISHSKTLFSVAKNRIIPNCKSRECINNL